MCVLKTLVLGPKHFCFRILVPMSMLTFLQTSKTLLESLIMFRIQYCLAKQKCFEFNTFLIKIINYVSNSTPFCSKSLIMFRIRYFYVQHLHKNMNSVWKSAFFETTTWKIMVPGPVPDPAAGQLLGMAQGTRGPIYPLRALGAPKAC